MSPDSGSVFMLEVFDATLASLEGISDRYEA
jgi:hypothetical protein